MPAPTALPIAVLACFTICSLNHPSYSLGISFPPSSNGTNASDGKANVNKTTRSDENTEHMGNAPTVRLFIVADLIVVSSFDKRGREEERGKQGRKETRKEARKGGTAESENRLDLLFNRKWKRAGTRMFAGYGAV